jgi:hypothetical protein
MSDERRGDIVNAFWMIVLEVLWALFWFGFGVGLGYGLAH